MAHDLGLPIVRLVDGSGGGGSVKTLDTMRASFVPFNPAWDWVVANLSRVPVVSLCLGSVAGLGAARVVTSHYSMMVKGTSQLFVAGPPIVKRLGEDVDKETLGGSHIHTRNGSVDDEVGSEEEAFARARQFLSYLPSSVGAPAPRVDSGDDPNRREPSLARRDPARAAQGLQGAADHRGRRRPRQLLRDGSDVGSLRGDRTRPARRPLGRGARQRSVLLRGRLDRRRVPEGRALRRPRRDVPDSRGALRGQPGLRDRDRGGAGRHHPPRRAHACRDLPGPRAVVLGDRAQGLRRGRRSPPERVAASATGSRGRRASGDHSHSRAASRPPTRPSSRRPTTRRRSARRSRPGSRRPARRSEPPRRS